MEFAFRSDAGLRVTYHDTTAHCYLREVDVMAHGVSPDTMNDNSTEASFDSSPARLAIREAGWETFEFRKDKGEETADLFASCQYLASLPSNTNKVKVLKAVATSLEEPAEEALVIMQKVTVHPHALCLQNVHVGSTRVSVGWLELEPSVCLVEWRMQLS